MARQYSKKYKEHAVKYYLAFFFYNNSLFFSTEKWNENNIIVS